MILAGKLLLEAAAAAHYRTQLSGHAQASLLLVVMLAMLLQQCLQLQDAVDFLQHAGALQHRQQEVRLHRQRHVVHQQSHRHRLAVQPPLSLPLMQHALLLEAHSAGESAVL